jgi:hypothetical protein
MEIMRFIASISDDTPAGIVMAGTAGKVIAAAVVVEVGIAWAGVDCSLCTDYPLCIDCLIFAFCWLFGDYLISCDNLLHSLCLKRDNFGVNAGLEVSADLWVSTDLWVSAGFRACAYYQVSGDFLLPDVFGLRGCLPLRRGCLARPALINARAITR